MNKLAGLISGILFVLSGIHIYWLLGGTIGMKYVIPSLEDKESLFQPSQLSTAIVAFLLALAGLIVLLLGKKMMLSFIPQWLINVASWGIAIIFIMRAIGDFFWLGFFKKIKNTLFAQWDSLLFSPLCLLIAMGIIVILIANRK